ncbi:MAG: BMP family ABC transporter substrate-binding protein [Thermoleophilia bacterium]|nr:BMP family ABC transporter substrate-binding protein [Thermoleophilia bacterium]
MRSKSAEQHKVIARRRVVRRRLVKSWAAGAVTALWVVLLLPVLVGCGEGPTTTGSEAQTSGSSAVTTSATAPSSGSGPSTSIISVPNSNQGPSSLPAKVAIVAPEKSNDFGWNQEGVRCARQIAEEIGAQVEVSENAGYEDVSPIYRQLVANGADWVILWAGGYNTVGPQLAQETQTRTVVIGAFEQGLVPGLCADFETNAQEGAYLAGVLAATMSKTKVLGIVASADDENWNKMAAGFIVGARAALPEIRIEYAQVGQAAYADAAAAKRVTANVIATGADIILGMGDGSTFGMMQAVENATPPQGAEKVWFIDVIGDKTSLDTKHVLLTSVVWDYMPLFRDAVRRMQEGTYGTEVTYLDLKNGGIGLLRTPHIPAEMWERAEQAKAQVIAGAVEIPVIYKKSDLEPLLR